MTISVPDDPQRSQQLLSPMRRCIEAQNQWWG
jgi:hypothetical protein